MKTSTFARLVAIGSLAALPFTAAQSTETEVVMQACVKTFVADNFPGRTTRVNTLKPYTSPSPLAAQMRPRVKLQAVGVDSGRTLAAATCTQKNGTVTVAPSADVSLVAAR